jgi:dolichol-phosphate mannosyltransferase
MDIYKVSVIIPVFNEGRGVLAAYEAVRDVFNQLKDEYSYEIIFINDGSKDDSWGYIQQCAALDKQVRAVNFARNFGYQSALTAGYDVAQGQAVITMDADLQHPPSLIPAMLAKWKAGNSIVYARRKERHDSFLKKFTATCYYHILELISDVRIPRNITDFKVINEPVLKEIRKFKEKARYMRGLVAWTGFDYDVVEFVQPERAEGITKYSWLKLFKMAFDGITSFSLMPLKLAGFVGMFVILTGIAMFIFIMIESLFFNGYYPLFKWLVTIIYIFMGVQFMLLWLLGEYIGRVFEQQKDRPLYVVKDQLNF